MALNDAEAHDQIDQMVRFIKQEAQEKASEIGVSAEEVRIISVTGCWPCDERSHLCCMQSVVPQCVPCRSTAAWSALYFVSETAV